VRSVITGFGRAMNNTIAIGPKSNNDYDGVGNDDGGVVWEVWMCELCYMMRLHMKTHPLTCRSSSLARLLRVRLKIC